MRPVVIFALSAATTLAQFPQTSYATPQIPFTKKVPPAILGKFYTYQVVALSDKAVSFNATGLPPGLLIDQVTGLVSGTPTTAGSFFATVSARNEAGEGTTELRFVVLAQEPPPFLPPGGVFGILTILGNFDQYPLWTALTEGRDGDFYGATDGGNSIVRITPSGQITTLLDYGEDLGSDLGCRAGSWKQWEPLWRYAQRRHGR